MSRTKPTDHNFRPVSQFMD